MSSQTNMAKQWGNLRCAWSEVKVARSCPALWDSMDYTVHGILQARILEWVAFPFSRGSSQPKDQTQVSRIAGRFFTSWATREAQDASERCNTCYNLQGLKVPTLNTRGVVLEQRKSMGFPGGSDGKESAWDPGFDPWVGKIPWTRKQQPTLVFLTGKSHEQRSLVGYSPWGHKSWTGLSD